MTRIGPDAGERSTGRTSWIDRLLHIDRRIIFLAVAVAVVIPVLKPIGLPVLPSKEAQDFFDQLEALKTGDTIIFSLDYEADTRAELDPMSLTVFKYCFREGVRIIALTNYAGGPGLVEALFEEADPEHGKTYGTDYVFLGYNADWQGTMLRLGESIRATFPTDHYGAPIADMPIMRGVDRYADIPLVVTVAASALGEYWAIFAGGKYGQKVIAGCTAIQAVLVYPYYNTDQILGFLGGLKGAAELENLAGIAGVATRGMDAQSSAHGLIVLFILIGNGAYLAQRMRQRRQASVG